MRKSIYYVGRTFQLLALLWMPLTIWTGHLGHNERGAILIFTGSLALFWAGWGLTKSR